MKNVLYPWFGFVFSKINHTNPVLVLHNIPMLLHKIHMLGCDMHGKWTRRRHCVIIVIVVRDF